MRSVLGRYLEHSRIYRFAHGGDDDGPLFLIGSADLMPRNLDRRVETLVPIAHPKHQAWLDQVLEFQLADDIVAWDLQPDNTWAPSRPLEDASSPTARSACTTGSAPSSGGRGPVRPGLSSARAPTAGESLGRHLLR